MYQIGGRLYEVGGHIYQTEGRLYELGGHKNGQEDVHVRYGGIYCILDRRTSISKKEDVYVRQDICVLSSINNYSEDFSP